MWLQRVVMRKSPQMSASQENSTLWCHWYFLFKIFYIREASLNRHTHALLQQWVRSNPNLQCKFMQKRQSIILPCTNTDWSGWQLQVYAVRVGTTDLVYYDVDDHKLLYSQIFCKVCIFFAQTNNIWRAPKDKLCTFPSDFSASRYALICFVFWNEGS